MGAYSISTLTSQLQTLTFLTVTYHINTYQMVFTGNSSFTLAFTTSNNCAKVLGFVSGSTYNSSSNVITFPYAFDLSQDNVYIRITNLPMPNYASRDMNFSVFINVYENSNRIIFLHTADKPQEIDLENQFNSNIFNVELRDRKK